jgi:hypothetical protein
MSEIIREVTGKTGLSEEQALQVVEVVIAYLQEQLALARESPRRLPGRPPVEAHEPAISTRTEDGQITVLV